MREKTYKRIFVSFTIIMLMIISLPSSVQATQKAKNMSPVVRNGILDLSQWDPEKDGIVDLSGEWDFYWKKLLTYNDLQDNDASLDIRASVPSVWNAYQIGGRSLPGFGYATYRIKVINANQDIPITFRIPTMSTAYRMFIDDELIASNGIVTNKKEQFIPENRPITGHIVPKASQFNIIVQVSNYVYARGGMWYSIEMGTPGQMQELTRNAIYKDLFLLGSFFIMGLYYLSIFLLRREDKGSLYFVFICLVAIVRTLLHGDYAIYRLLPSISFETVVLLNYYTVFWAGTTFVLFLGELFPEEVSKKAVRASVIYSTGISAIAFFTPISFYTTLKTYMMIAVSLIVAYGLICTLVAFFRKKQNALIVLMGALVVALGVFHDVLYHSQMLPVNLGELTAYGFFVFLFLQSFILSRRFSKAFDNVNDLSERLLQLDKLKDEFLANTSHELRTPLNGILGITEALMRGSEGPLNEGQKNNLSIISASSRRLSNLVNDILDYSKMKHGDVKLNCKAIRINTIVRTTLMVMNQTNRSSDVNLINAIDGELPYVIADENRLAQILYNLVGNALKFTEQGHVRVSASISGDRVVICVEDTGEGIPEKKFDNIFTSFEQLDTSPIRKHGGTGLGLSITKHLVELHRGRIWVESTVGKGSKFYFTLPVAKDQPQEKETEIMLSEIAATAAVKSQGTFRSITDTDKHILIVDDEIVNLQSAAATLKMEGYAITAVDGGAAALREIRKDNSITLVILDVMMPEMSGYEVCRKIRENKSLFDLPVLMLTAKTTTEDIVMGFEAGANDYLSKPFETEELLARAKTLVNLKISVDQAMASELAFLQAQIKPHFLFNTLNTISCFCDTDPGRAEQLINTLAHYLRTSFDFNNLEMFVPIEKEISLINSYVEIEQARFGRSMKIKFDIDESIEVNIPPLSIQPLVENAIRHGLRKKGFAGAVIISIQKQIDGIQIAVSDDGIGIPCDRVDKLLTEYSSGGVGLRNIELRLRKLYGNGLVIESEVGKGTNVMFLIPFGGE